MAAPFALATAEVGDLCCYLSRSGASDYRYPAKVTRATPTQVEVQWWNRLNRPQLARFIRGTGQVMGAGKFKGYSVQLTARTEGEFPEHV